METEVFIALKNQPKEFRYTDPGFIKKPRQESFHICVSIGLSGLFQEIWELGLIPTKLRGA